MTYLHWRQIMLTFSFLSFHGLWVLLIPWSSCSQTNLPTDTFLPLSKLLSPFFPLNVLSPIIFLSSSLSSYIPIFALHSALCFPTRISCPGYFKVGEVFSCIVLWFVLIYSSYNYAAASCLIHFLWRVLGEYDLTLYWQRHLAARTTVNRFLGSRNNYENDCNHLKKKTKTCHSSFTL